MRFVSSRNLKNQVDFRKAVLDCMPEDGGLYVPDDTIDLRKWILYSNENTSFSSLAGSLTSALIGDEFSPIICETIASRAFSNNPKFLQLDKNLFQLELYGGATGTFKDYGVTYLASALETILQYYGEKSILLDATTGELGACMSHALKGKKLLKSVLLAPAGKFRGMKEEDFVWNGGNIYPIEVNGTDEDCHNLVRKIFSDRSLVEKYHLTVANTANIGRLLPQAFFYTYAFSRVKSVFEGDIYYALSAGNYGTLVAGLYGWKLCMPLNGFVVPESKNLVSDVTGNCMVLDEMIPVNERLSADPSSPSNIERFEQIFNANSLMMKSFVYPAKVSAEETSEACKTLYKKYGIFADSSTSASYAAALKRKDVCLDEESCVVLISHDAPSKDSGFIKHNLGECPEAPENVKRAFAPVSLEREAIAPDDVDSLISVLNSLNLLRIF